MSISFRLQLGSAPRGERFARGFDMFRMDRSQSLLIALIAVFWSLVFNASNALAGTCPATPTLTDQGNNQAITFVINIDAANCVITVNTAGEANTGTAPTNGLALELIVRPAAGGFHINAISRSAGGGGPVPGLTFTGTGIGGFAANGGGATSGVTTAQILASNVNRFDADAPDFSNGSLTISATIGGTLYTLTLTGMTYTSATGEFNANVASITGGVFSTLPTVNTVTPSSGPTAGGTQIVIAGTGFTGATAVQVGGVDAAGFTVDNDSQITATTPTGTAGTVSVNVTRASGANTANGFFTYLPNAAEIQRAVARFMQNRASSLLNNQPDIGGFIDGSFVNGGGPLGNLRLVANTQNLDVRFLTSLGHLWQQIDSTNSLASNPGVEHRNIGSLLPANQQDLSGSSNATVGSNLFPTQNAYASRLNSQNGENLSASQQRGYDVWFQMAGSRTSAGNANNNFWVGYLGGHVFFSPNLLVGGLVQMDWAEETNDTAATSADGKGWMVGPYLAAKHSDRNLFLNARVAYGRSDNDLTVSNTEGNFQTERWLVNAKLAGLLEYGNLNVRPALSASYFSETQESYTDNASTFVPSQRISQGELRFGPTFSYESELDGDMTLRPEFGVNGVWNFDVSNGAATTGSVLGTGSVRARLDPGVVLISPGKFRFKLAGYYDGLGADDYYSYGGSAKIVIPLQ